MKIGVLQLNYQIADVKKNAEKIVSSAKSLYTHTHCDLIVTSELALTGYPPKDLLLRPSFLSDIEEYISWMAGCLSDAPPLLVGAPIRNPTGIGKSLYNGVILVSGGKAEHCAYKSLLPTDDVFDDARYFSPSHHASVRMIAGKRCGITVCEDVWNDPSYWSHTKYAHNPLPVLHEQGIDLLINLSASPFFIGKQKTREDMVCALSSRYGVPVVYVNQVGGYDDLVFDGGSFAASPIHGIMQRAKRFEEDVRIIDIDQRISQDDASLQEEEEVWRALVLGTKDFVEKSGKQHVVLGLSGGIDSCLTAMLAVDALGSNHVHCVMMPSPYTSQESIDDAKHVADVLGVSYRVIPIDSLLECYKTVLQDGGHRLSDIAKQNIQARIRGNILMSLSNTEGSLVLSTGNKSEMAVGYCTLYGDMVGAYAPLCDVSKTRAYQLANWINTKRPGNIPSRIIQKPPSAELAPNQKDEDTLPPYDRLDCILEDIVEHQKNINEIEIKQKGYKREEVQRVWDMVWSSEYKRKQSAPGPKITQRAFGSGWRIPINKTI